MTRSEYRKSLIDICTLSKTGFVPPIVFVSGSVGCGKSFLINQCLEETGVDFGTVRCGEIYSSKLFNEAMVHAVKVRLIIFTNLVSWPLKWGHISKMSFSQNGVRFQKWPFLKMWSYFKNDPFSKCGHISKMTLSQNGVIFQKCPFHKMGSYFKNDPFSKWGHISKISFSQNVVIFQKWPFHKMGSYFKNDPFTKCYASKKGSEDSYFIFYTTKIASPRGKI